MSNFRGGNSTVEQQLLELSRKGDVKELIKLIRDNKKLNLNAVNSLGSTALIEASSKGHVDVVKVLLEKGADVHATRNSGWSALMVASGEGFVSVAQILMDAGADVNHAADDVGTPLLLACLRGHAAMVQLLLQQGADVHAVNAQDGWTPLILSAKSGHVDVVRILVDAGAELNAADTLGRTAVMWASAENVGDVVQYLIDAGVDLTLVDNDFDTAEDIARNCEHYEVADILATHFHPLRDAAEQGDFKRIQRLLREKTNMNLNSTDANGMTALMIACKEGHFKIVHALVNAGAEVNMPDHSGATPIIEACKQSHEEITRLLLEYGSHVNAIDTEGESSLMVASSRGNLELTKLLLDEGADVNLAKYEDGTTALMLASEQGYLDIVSLLLEHGADFRVTNSKGETAMDIAHKCGMEEVENILSQIQNPLVFACKKGDLKEVKKILAQDPTLDLELSASDGNTALMVACSAGAVDIARELISRGANVNASNSNGGTALMDASWNGYLDIVRLLVDKNANVNAIDDEGGTALMLACKNGHLGVTKVLMDRGANVNAVKLDDGWTSIFFASENGYAEIVQSLISRGANVNATDHENWTPLMEACIEGHTNIAMTLLENNADINASTNDGWTPLMLSSLRGHYDTVVALINEGAQINAVDNDRVSALMWASKSGHLDIVKKLVQLQADFNMTNTLGETAQDIAVKANKIEVAEFLSTLSDNALSAAPIRSDKAAGSKMANKIDEKNYILLDILEGRIFIYKTLYDPYYSFARYPLQYIKDCTDNFRSNFGKGVYKAAFVAIDKTNPKLKFNVKRITAIKMTDASLNLQDEVSALVQARHPNILRVYGYAINEKFHNEAYLVLESVPKYGSLNEFLAKDEKRKILNATHRCRIICDVVKAITFLHNGGVVDGTSEYIFLHRDISSSCICLSADLTAKLVIDYDKAIVRLRDEEENEDSSDGAVVGSPGYTCPWYLRGNRRYQAECDLFSFGVILLEILTGSLQAGQTSDRSFGEDLVDRYFFSNEKSSFLVKDADPLAGNEWSPVLSIIAKVALSCVDFDPFKRPNVHDMSDKLLQVCDKILYEM